MSSWTSGYVADLSYTHGFYRELTPALLSFTALTTGQIQLHSTGLAYCELGCGQGFSANLLAAANPHIEFHATDFNPAHIANARALQAQAGTPNIRFYEDSFEEFLNNPELPQFDFVCLHGIYTWVAPEHRATIVQFLRRKVKPGGIVYISYNTLPGWAMAAPMRHLMYIKSKMLSGPTIGRLDPALTFVQSVIDADANYFRNNPALKERFERIKGHNRNYIAHEYLNDAWTPFYHQDVANDLSEAKLSYLCSAFLLDQIDAINLTLSQQAVLVGVPDLAIRETVRDYLTGQQFRRDLFVRGRVQANPVDTREAWLDTRFALTTPREDVPMKVTGSLGEATLQEETYDPILDALAKGPRTLRSILEDERVAKLGWGKITQALTILVGTTQLQPCASAKDDSKRAQRTKAFNDAVCRAARGSNELMALASPVTGGGFNVDQIGQLFLAARAMKNVDPVDYAAGIMASLGRALVKEGKTLGPEENLGELKALYETFKTKRLPMMTQIGIA